MFFLSICWCWPEEPVSGCSSSVFLLPAIRVPCDEGRACKVANLRLNAIKEIYSPHVGNQLDGWLNDTQKEVNLKKKRGMIPSHLTTPSPISCIKVDYSLLFSIGLCHLRSDIICYKRKLMSPHLRFPSWGWNFCCSSNAWLGFILTLMRKFTFKEFSQF